MCCPLMALACWEAQNNCKEISSKGSWNAMLDAFFRGTGASSGTSSDVKAFSLARWRGLSASVGYYPKSWSLAYEKGIQDISQGSNMAKHLITVSSSKWFHRYKNISRFMSNGPVGLFRGLKALSHLHRKSRSRGMRMVRDEWLPRKTTL